jgi:hypothetical protein
MSSATGVGDTREVSYRLWRRWVSPFHSQRVKVPTVIGSLAPHLALNLIISHHSEPTPPVTKTYAEAVKLRTNQWTDPNNYYRLIRLLLFSRVIN